MECFFLALHHFCRKCFRRVFLFLASSFKRAVSDPALCFRRTLQSVDATRVPAKSLQALTFSERLSRVLHQVSQSSSRVLHHVAGKFVQFPQSREWKVIRGLASSFRSLCSGPCIKFLEFTSSSRSCSGEFVWSPASGCRRVFLGFASSYCGPCIKFQESLSRAPHEVSGECWEVCLGPASSFGTVS